MLVLSQTVDSRLPATEHREITACRSQLLLPSNMLFIITIPYIHEWEGKCKGYTVSTDSQVSYVDAKECGLTAMCTYEITQAYKPDFSR